MKRGVDYIGVGVGAVIINRDGKIFCHKRGKKARNENGKWDMPGGSVEFNERCEDALVREMIEEHGFVVESVEFLEFCNHIIKDEGQHWVALTFICRVKEGEPKILEPEKCEEIGWFDMNEIAKLDLTITTKLNYQCLQKKFPKGLPNLYK